MPDTEQAPNPISVEKSKTAPSVVSISLVVLVIVAGVGGYLAGSSKAAGKAAPVNTAPQQSSIKLDPIFIDQIGTITGKVTQVSGKSITIVNQNGVTESFNIAQTFANYLNPSNSNSNATPSADMSKIQVNKNAAISLKLNAAGAYEVVSIFYPPTPSTPPAKSPTSSTSVSKP